MARILNLRLALREMRERHQRDQLTLSRWFPVKDFAEQFDCATEAQRNLGTAVAEIDGLLAMSDAALDARLQR